MSATYAMLSMNYFQLFGAKNMDEPKNKSELVNFPGRASSKVWQHFAFEKKNDQVLKEKAICRICYQSCKYTGGTTNLILHLEHNHGMNLKRNVDVKPTRTIASMFGSQVKDNQGPLPSAKAKAIDLALKEFVIKDVRPLFIVDGDGFVEVIRACEPRYIFIFCIIFISLIHQYLLMWGKLMLMV